MSSLPRIAGTVVLAAVALLAPTGEAAAQQVVPAAPESASSPGQPGLPGQDLPLRARSFTIRHRRPLDVALLIQPVLSEQGSYTLKPALKTIIVQDEPAALSRIAALIRSFDIPPRNVEITINLLMGSRKPPEGQALPQDIRGIINVLPDITKYRNYRLLDAVSIVGTEGASVRRALAGDTADGGTAAGYRVHLGIQAVDEEHGVITINPFSVQRETRAGSRIDRWKQVYSTKLNLRDGRLLTIGSARNAQSEKALFLTIRARIVE